MKRKPSLARFAAVAAVAALFGLASHVQASARTFVTSARENADGTVTLPLYRGLNRGREVWYVVLDSSDGSDADRLGVNVADKLDNARGTVAVQKVSVVNGEIVFPATVDFSPVRSVVAGPDGFPVERATPGAVGEAGYSPLIELPNGVVRNAPQLGNWTGLADKVVAIDYRARTVRYRLTDGFANGRAVKYISTDASDPVVAALEDATYAAALGDASVPDGDGSDSAYAFLAAFTNGQTGAGNPQRQGLRSAVLDGLDPLNLLFWTPNQGRYSPLWDVHPSEWQASTVAAGRNLRQTDRSDLLNLVQDGTVTGPGATPWASLRIIVNCPIISSE